MIRRLFSAALAAALFATPVLAEEGMWTVDAFPIARANAALGTHVDQAFLTRVQGAAVNLGGCSAGLVSANGLVLTNNHCVADCVHDLSTQQQQYALTGFTPATREEERACPGMTAQIVTAITDVTGRMQAAGAGQTGRAFTAARDAEAGRIEAEACAGADATRRCTVVSLYRGGQFKLYVYRRYTDLRLAFAPEDAAANFGGDLDNFSFPRFGLDAAFLRLYENGRPASTPVFFPWNPAPPTQNQPVFVVGNPGATQRLLTEAQIATVRDVILPMDQLTSSELRGRLIAFSDASDENRFVAQEALYGVENSYKRGIGRMAALIDRDFMARRAAAEADFRRRVAANRALSRRIGDPWGDLERLQPEQRRLYPAYSFLEQRAGGGSQLFAWARTLVRAAQERARPSEQRLPEFGEARLNAVRNGLLAPTPTYPALERLRLEWWLSKTREVLTVDDPRIRPLLGNESPEQLSARLVTGSRLADPAVRQRLWEGGLAAVQASDDPMIRYVLSIQEPTRAARAEWEERVAGPTEIASAALAEARFAAYGDAVYPDATGTLRVTYGRVEGWTYQGRTVPFSTTYAGLWARATGASPFQVPPRLLAARGRIPDSQVFDVVASTDTIGGSSGSPAIDAQGRLIGANFDSTILTQRNAYGYDRRVNRSVLVTASVVDAALRQAYGMTRLAEELAGR